MAEQYAIISTFYRRDKKTKPDTTRVNGVCVYRQPPSKINPDGYRLGIIDTIDPIDPSMYTIKEEILQYFYRYETHDRLTGKLMPIDFKSVVDELKALDQCLKLCKDGKVTSLDELKSRFVVYLADFAGQPIAHDIEKFLDRLGIIISALPKDTPNYLRIFNDRLCEEIEDFLDADADLAQEACTEEDEFSIKVGAPFNTNEVVIFLSTRGTRINGRFEIYNAYTVQRSNGKKVVPYIAAIGKGILKTLTDPRLREKITDDNGVLLMEFKAKFSRKTKTKKGSSLDSGNSKIVNAVLHKLVD